MTSYPREFSIAEANALIPELEKRLKNLIAKKESYSREHDYLFMSELLVTAEKEAGGFTDKRHVDRDANALEESLSEFESEMDVIRKTGCVVRDFDKGWIDFLGKYQGNLVYFSWRLGEKEIAYYHGTDENAEERRKIR